MLTKNAFALSLLSVCISLHASSLEKFLATDTQKQLKKGAVYLSLAGGFCASMYIMKEAYVAAFGHPELDNKRTAERFEQMVDRRVAARVGSEKDLVKKVAAAVRADMTVENAAAQASAAKPESGSPSVNSQLAALRDEIAKLKQGGQPIIPQPSSVGSVKDAIDAIEHRSDASKPDSSGDKKDDGKAS